MGYTTLKAALDAAVKTNGRQEITGANLNGVMTTLLQGVDILDRANPADTSGMNHVVLKKNKTFAEQVSGTNTIYEIRDNFDLGGTNLTLPAGCVFRFWGGSISNGTITIDGCEFEGVNFIGSNVTIQGNPKTSTAKVAWFVGSTDKDRLEKALSYSDVWKNFVCGTLNISSSINLTQSIGRSVTLSDGIFNLSADLFITSLNYVGLPNFEKCVFNGNGYRVFGSKYGVWGTFNICGFNECSIQSTTETGSLCQSLTLSNCYVQNNSVNLIKCERLYDCHMIAVKCEAQTASVVDTSFSTETFGGTRNLWVSDSIFEGFTTNPVFNLVGGLIRFSNCYFEANDAGCVNVTRNTGVNNALDFVMNGCSIVTTRHNAVTISGYATGSTVIVSFYGNQFNTGGTNYYLVSGLDAAYNGIMALCANKKGQTSDRFSAEPTFPYNFTEVKNPTPHSTYFTRYYGGYLQIGKLVFVDFVLSAKADSSSAIANAVTGLPAAQSYNIHGMTTNPATGAEAVSFVIKTDGTLTMGAGVATGSYYRVRAFYWTNSKSDNVY